MDSCNDESKDIFNQCGQGLSADSTPYLWVEFLLVLSSALRDFFSQVLHSLISPLTKNKNLS